MPLKILCAGYSKDEKFDIEKRVRSMFGPPLGDMEWTISLVKMGGQASVSVDGPDERIRAKSFMASPSGIEESLHDLLRNHGFDIPDPASTPPPVARSASRPPLPLTPPPRAATPPPIPAPRPPAPEPRPPAPAKRPEATSEPHRFFIPAPPPSSSPVKPPAAAPRPPAPAPKPPSTAQARPAPPPPARGVSSPGLKARPSAPTAAQHVRDTHQCPSCDGRFVVAYEMLANEPRQLVAVACPHCWKLDRVEVAEGAAIERAYRADKA
jgi:hypothetical protein